MFLGYTEQSLPVVYPPKGAFEFSRRRKNLKVLHVSQNDGILWPNLCYYYF